MASKQERKVNRRCPQMHADKKAMLHGTPFLVRVHLRFQILSVPLAPPMIIAVRTLWRPAPSIRESAATPHGVD
jgi:hypothetical protein